MAVQPRYQLTFSLGKENFDKFEMLRVKFGTPLQPLGKADVFRKLIDDATKVLKKKATRRKFP